MKQRYGYRYTIHWPHRIHRSDILYPTRNAAQSEGDKVAAQLPGSECRTHAVPVDERGYECTETD